MSKDSFIFEVTQKSFSQAVIQNSNKIPVIVEFMGVWSEPCIAMDNVFSDLAIEFSEKFIFAKVDIDEQEELSKEYKIKNIPTLLVFKDGELVRTEVGELKEKEARELLKDFGIFHQVDLMREQAREKHLSGDTPTAILLLTDAIKMDPSNTLVAMDMVQIFIDINELEQANDLFKRLPEDTHTTEMGKTLSGQLLFANFAAKTDSIDELQNRLSLNNNDYDARFDLSINQIVQCQYDEALENLFFILKENSEYKEGAAKEMIITVSNMLAPVNNELSQEIRRKLSNQLA